MNPLTADLSTRPSTPIYISITICILQDFHIIVTIPPYKKDMCQTRWVQRKPAQLPLKGHCQNHHPLQPSSIAINMLNFESQNNFAIHSVHYANIPVVSVVLFKNKNKNAEQNLPLDARRKWSSNLASVCATIAHLDHSIIMPVVCMYIRRARSRALTQRCVHVLRVEHPVVSTFCPRMRNDLGCRLAYAPTIVVMTMRRRNRGACGSRRL